MHCTVQVRLLEQVLVNIRLKVLLMRRRSRTWSQNANHWRRIHETHAIDEL